MDLIAYGEEGEYFLAAVARNVGDLGINELSRSRILQRLA
jgi:hypothetical protein